MYDPTFYRNRKQQMFEFLGGRCIRCWGTEELRFIHRNPEERSYYPLEHWNKAWNELIVELQKCDLMCKNCYTIKLRTKRTGRARGRYHTPTRIVEGPFVHGTTTGYCKFKCRCEECKEAHNAKRRIKELDD